MSRLRYRLRPEAAPSESEETPSPFVEVTVSDDSRRSEMDGVMGQLGYEPVGSVAGESEADVLYFPLPGQPIAPKIGHVAASGRQVAGPVPPVAPATHGPAPAARPVPPPVPRLPPPALAPSGFDATAGLSLADDEDRPTPIAAPPSAEVKTVAPATAPTLPALTAAAPPVSTLPSAAPIPVAEPSAVRARYSVAEALGRLPMWLTLFVFGLLIAAFVAQGAARSSDFKHDDFLFLYGALVTPFWEFIRDSYRGELMPVQKMFFAALFRMFGLDADRFFVVVLVTHVINTSLLHAIVRRLTGRALLPLVAAGVWAMAPVQQGALAWLSAYGQVFATTCVLFALLGLAQCVEERRPPSAFALLRASILLALAALSFGAGFAVGFVFPLFAWLLLPDEAGRRRVALTLLPLPLLLIALHVVSRADLGGSAAPGLRSVLLVPHLMAYGFGSLLAPPLATVGGKNVTVLGELEPDAALVIGYVVFLPVVGLLGWLSWRAEPERRRRVAALCVLAGAVYTVIALAPGPIVGRKPLAVVATRNLYQYLGTVGPVLLIAFAADQLIPRRRARWMILAAAAGLLVIAGLGRVVGSMVDDGTATANRKLIDGAVEEIDGYVASAQEGTNVHINNRPLRFVRSASGGRVEPIQFPGLAALFTLVYPTNTVDQRHVYFVEADEQLVAQVRASGSARMAELLVTRQDAARAGAQVQGPQRGVEDLRRAPRRPPAFERPGGPDAMRSAPPEFRRNPAMIESMRRRRQRAEQARQVPPATPAPAPSQ